MPCIINMRRLKRGYQKTVSVQKITSKDKATAAAPWPLGQGRASQTHS